MYEPTEGTLLRRVEACGGGPWGVLRVCWVPISTGVGSSAVVADTGGSVWLLRFTRTLGIRGTKVSCLFSGARGEVCYLNLINIFVFRVCFFIIILLILGLRFGAIA